MSKQEQFDLFNSNPKGMAVISICEKYRYWLERVWDTEKPKVMFLMLNPSTADSNEDDPTIRRCIGFAKSWGYGSLCVGNIFAYRSTNPKALLTIEDPIGIETSNYLKKMAESSSMIVCAWGNSPIINNLLKKFPAWQPLSGLTELHYIELSNDGTPKHPLYLKGDLLPQKYEIPRLRILT